MPKNPIRNALELAVELNASDIHIKIDTPITFRVNGALAECNFSMNTACMDDLISLMLSAEQRMHFLEKGDVDLSYVEDGVGRFRVNVHMQRGRPAIAMRYVKSKIPDFDELELPPQIRKLAEFERGIVFLTGTTGSGKSTTLASVINHINKTVKKHIITVEDPIEYELKDENCFIEQREVGLDTISFDSALRAADTGHLVFSTLHTINAAQSINRILDFITHLNT